MVKKKLFVEKKKFFCCRLCKNYWITYCTHMTSHAIWVDKIADVMISIKKLKHFEKIFLNKFYKIWPQDDHSSKTTNAESAQANSHTIVTV